MSTQILKMENIDKKFPGVHALSKCNFNLNKGEVHALVGENGAGKSTLMKILTGVYKKDEGDIIYFGEKVEINSPKQAQELGISIIHQELNLAPDLTLAQNIFIGREDKCGNAFFINDNVINKKADEIFKLLNLSLNPKTKVSDITVAKQQMVEIAKALSFDAKVLIMDEPTAALTDSEIEELFKIINNLKEKGTAIIYISHRMDEIFKITDRITIMRDGKYIDTVKTKETNLEEIIKMMVGRELFESKDGKEKTQSNEVVLEVKNLNRGKIIKDVSFDLKKGEILGFAGLMGAGRTEVARAIFGADKIDSGEIYVKGKKVNIKSPKDAVKASIGYLSEDRKLYGLTVMESVGFNISLASISRFLKYGSINNKKINKVSKEYIKSLNIKTPSEKQIARNLSGGNQQKVVIAKWLVRDSEILIFDEPTRGIDIGAKNEIYKLLNKLTKEGKSIIMISSELPEVLRMSDRVVVMCEGKITKILDIKDATQENIMKYATLREHV